MKKLLILTLVLVCSTTLLAQSPPELINIEDRFDALTAEWLNRSGELKTYSGLANVCGDAEYRTGTVELLSLIHHYDSLVIEALNDPANIMIIDHKEWAASMKDITKFETQYGARSFLSHLRESCQVRQELERDKDDLQKQSGQYSYDSQVLLLENEIRKYLKHMDKKVIRIDDHLHLLHLDQVVSYELLTARD